MSLLSDKTFGFSMAGIKNRKNSDNVYKKSMESMCHYLLDARLQKSIEKCGSIE